MHGYGYSARYALRMARKPRIEYEDTADGGTVIEVISANGKTVLHTENLAGVHGVAQVRRRMLAALGVLDEALGYDRIVKREER